ncbi:hypothetical protein GW17_00047833 [Ensete ventricosum]|nr:hypothetical protein GW17_00047833 [Ensete ventricosum]
MAYYVAQDGKPVMSASLVGGENEALERLKKFAAECCAQPNKGNRDNTRNSIYGANFSCKISPWLAMGCLSPRFMFAKLKKTATRYFSCMQLLNAVLLSCQVHHQEVQLHKEGRGCASLSLYRCSGLGLFASVESGT